MRIIIFFLMCSCFFISGCEPRPKLFELKGVAQGTTWHISFWSNYNVNPDAINADINAHIDDIDKTFSNYRSDSTISLFNSNMSISPMVVGKDMVNLIEQAKSVSEKSHGCYDLTIKSLFDAWGFDKEQLTIPTEITIFETLRFTGMHHLSVDNNSLAKNNNNVHIDLSSIAQGYSVSVLAKALEHHDIKNYMIEIGGEMVIKGYKPDGSYWRIAIERPLPGKRTLQKIVTLQKDQAVMTSGTYRHYFDNRGIQYPHILDARTGYPVMHNTVSVTVIHDDPILADAWSTALLCLGSEDGVKVADDNNIKALFISQQNDDTLIEKVSSAFLHMKDAKVE